MVYTCTGDLCLGSVLAIISNLIDLVPEFFQHSDMLVTCLDSDTQPSKMGHWTANRLAKARVVFYSHGPAILITQSSVPTLLDRVETVYHFDELFLSRNFTLADLGEFGDKFTSEICDFSHTIPPEFLNMFRSLSPALSLRWDSTKLCSEKSLASKIEELGTELELEENAKN